MAAGPCRAFLDGTGVKYMRFVAFLKADCRFQHAACHIHGTRGSSQPQAGNRGSKRGIGEAKSGISTALPLSRKSPSTSLAKRSLAARIALRFAKAPGQALRSLLVPGARHLERKASFENQGARALVRAGADPCRRYQQHGRHRKDSHPSILTSDLPSLASIRPRASFRCSRAAWLQALSEELSKRPSVHTLRRLSA